MTTQVINKTETKTDIAQETSKFTIRIVMTMAALTEFAHLWTTRLTRKEEERLIAFERELRVGYKLQREGRFKEALSLYRGLEKRYADNPRIAKLATLQIRKLQGGKGKDAAARRRRGNP